jgi:hypothetical protein
MALCAGGAAAAEPPGIKWQRSLGGSGGDGAYSIQQTAGGGYVAAGGSASTDGDVTGNHGGSDYWVVKLGSDGGTTPGIDITIPDIDITAPAKEEFDEANERLAPSEVVVLPGINRPPLTNINYDWQVVGRVEDAVVSIRQPDPYALPECYAPTGREAADITIDISGVVSPGMKGLLPMTYAAVIGPGELTRRFGASRASEILAHPHGYLDEIFDVYVILNEVRQGEREDWFMRLVDGVLSPEEAVGLGILEVSGGESLTMALSYYVLDDSLLESFVRGDHLIIPDGRNDGVIMDPIWLNLWKDASGGSTGDAGGTVSSGKSGGGGGGCSSGSGSAAALIALIMAAALTALAWRLKSPKETPIQRPK